MGKNTEAVTIAQKEKMMEAIEANYGNITKAAKMVGIHPATHYRWLKEDEAYADQTEYMRDVSFRKIKDKLLEKALEKIDTGDSAILSRMMAIYLKNIPQEMDRISRYNNVRLLPKIRYIDTREQAEAIMRGEKLPD
jgi:hypothetical protein